MGTHPVFLCLAGRRCVVLGGDDQAAAKAEACRQAGAQLTVVAVPAQIYAITGSSAYVGLTGIFGLVPLVVFGLWGGALADVFDRRTLLIVTTAGLILTSARRRRRRSGRCPARC